MLQFYFQAILVKELRFVMRCLAHLDFAISLKQANEEIRIEREKTDAAKAKAQDDILKERKRHDEIVNAKDIELSAINKQLSENLKETMEKNNIITAYRLLVERYKNMSFIDRLFNRQPDENDLRPDMIKDTYVLDQSKEE
jgi:hypothetical protein